MLKTKQVRIYTVTETGEEELAFVYTVTEAGPREAARLVSSIAKVQRRLEELKAQPEPDEAALIEAEIMGVWAMIAPLLTPAMTYEDWTQTPLTQIAEIRKAAAELNPDWFDNQSGDIKKKDNAAPKSTKKSRK